MPVMRWTAIAVALVCASAPAANGQEAPLRVTLEEAIARAEQNSLRVAELQARVDVAAAAEAGRQAASRPAIALQGGYTRTNHVDEYTLPLQPFNPLYPDVPDNYRARVDLQWPIYTAGRGSRRSRVRQVRNARRRIRRGDGAPRRQTRSGAGVLGPDHRLADRERRATRARHARRPPARSPQPPRSRLDPTERRPQRGSAARTSR